jgi:hypothetical protein
VQLHSAANYESTNFLKPEPGLPAPFFDCSVFDCLNTKVFKSLETILHGFEFFGGVPLPIPDPAYDTEGILGAV